MKWYFAISESSFVRPEYDWPGLIRAAVKSAKRNTSLLPHMIYDGERNGFTDELTAMGVKIIPHRISFYEDIEKNPEINGREHVANYSGAYLRNEIPLIEQEDTCVLYTDCDVIFLKEPEFPAAPPAYFAAAPEENKDNYDDINTGVLLMNVPALRQELPAFLTFIKERIAAGEIADQPMYNLFYRGRFDHLDVRLNWKPYWGLEPSAQILHWHGPKPLFVRNSLENPEAGARTRHWWRLIEKNVPAYREFLKIWQDYGEFPAEDVFCLLDNVSDEGVWGWAIDRANPDRPLRMEAFIDAERVLEVVCSGHRPDVKRAGQPSEIVGYKFQIPDRYWDGRPHHLEFRSPATGLPHRFHHSGHWYGAYEFPAGIGSASSIPVADNLRRRTRRRTSPRKVTPDMTTESDLAAAAKAWNDPAESLESVNRRIHDAFPLDRLTERADGYLKFMFELFPYLSVKPNASIMEIGSGTGYLMEAMDRLTRSRSTPVERIVGLDIAEHMIAKAKRRLENSIFSFVHYDGIKIPFPDRSFDLIYSIAALQHVPKPYVYNLLFEIRRLLREGGSAVFQLLGFKVLPQQESVVPWREEIWLQVHRREGHWHHFYCAEELGFVLPLSGFTHIDIRDGPAIWCLVRNDGLGE